MTPAAGGVELPSVVRGAPLKDEPGLGALTIPAYLAELNSRYGTREALVMRTADGIARWSYATLWERSLEVARALLAVGVCKDSRIAVLMTNRSEFVSAMFGISLAGGVTVPLSTFSTASELEHLLKASCVSILLFEGEILKKDFVQVLHELEPAIEHSEPGQLRSIKFPYLRRLVRLGVNAASHPSAAIERWPDFLALGNAVSPALVQARAASVKPSDAGVLFFSSGTTSLPKGILHAQRAVALQWWRWPCVLGVTGEVRCWTANGFFWSGNFSMVIGSGLSTGGSIVLQSTFHPEEALELIAAERVTLPLAWPHQWAKLEGASNWSHVDLHCVRYVDPSTPLGRHPTVKTQWHEPPAYGATETLTIVASMPIRSPSDRVSHLQGPPFHGNTFKIVDPISGDVVPRGQRGEITVKGPTLMLGYLGVPADETLDADGFFHTGDSGYLDEAGRLFWEGRLSDMIKTGGANVSPREIDTALASYAGVKLSRTVGIPHESLGEAVVTCIVPHAGVTLDETAIREYLKQRLASYKIPRRVLFLRDDELSMTGSDKVKAAALIQHAMQKLG
jgi:acyl-CoA synthetase (AMP-forming)/AMP-acid ligase II